MKLQKQGFTLLELIISITILGIIVVIISSAMNVGFRSMNQGEKKMESLERMRASMKIIDSQIQSSIPITFLTKGNLTYYFSGQKETLRFASNFSLWSENRGYVVVTYRVVSDENRKKTLYADENIIGVKNKREVKLLEGFDEIYFEYFYKDLIKKDAEGMWIEEWKAYYIPEKIRLHLADGTKRVSIIIPMRAKESVL
jgi:general secretion pathway protein J